MKSKSACLKLIAAAVFCSATFQAGSAEAGPFDKLKKKVKEVKEVKDVIDEVKDSPKDQKEDKNNEEKIKNEEPDQTDTVDESTESVARISKVSIGSTSELDYFSLLGKQQSNSRHLLSYTGQKLLTLQADGSRVRVVCDGIESNPYSKVNGACFSPRGNSWGFIGYTSTKADIVVNGKILTSINIDNDMVLSLHDSLLYEYNKQSAYTTHQQTLGLRAIVFSPDGSRSAFVVADKLNQSRKASSGRGLGRDTGPYRVYVDGELLHQVESISMLTFSPGNQFILVSGGTHDYSDPSRRVYVDNEVGPEFENEYLRRIDFDESGKHVIYVTSTQNKPNSSLTQLYLNHKPMVSTTNLPEGSSVVHVEIDKSLSTVGVVTHSTLDEFDPQSVWTLWVNGSKAGELSKFDSYVIGPSGKFVLLNKDNRINVNGKIGFDYSALIGAAFSTSNAAIRYVVKSQLGCFIVDEMGNESGPLKNDVLDIQLSSDGSQCALFRARGLEINGEMLVQARREDVEIDDDFETIYLRNASYFFDQDSSIRESIAAAGKRLVVIHELSSDKAISQDGKYRAQLKRMYDSATKTKYLYTLYINNQPIGESFDEAAYPKFNENNTLNFIARKNDQVYVCTWQPE